MPIIASSIVMIWKTRIWMMMFLWRTGFYQKISVTLTYIAWSKTIITYSSCRASQINLAFVRISRTVFILIAGVQIVDTYPTVSLVTTRLLMLLVIILNPVQLLTDLLEHLRNLQKIPTKFFFQWVFPFICVSLILYLRCNRWFRSGPAVVLQ